MFMRKSDVVTETYKTLSDLISIINVLISMDVLYLFRARNEQLSFW